jgi:tetratricopeptide (TPR) repeat protein
MSFYVRFPFLSSLAKRVSNMRKMLHLLISIILLSSIAGCLPSFDPEAEEHFWQGIEYLKDDDQDSAMKEFSTAIEIDPDYSLAYYNRALIYYRNGDLESSLAEYNKALELDPKNPYWTYERGFLHLQLGYREKAIYDLERSLELGLSFSDRSKVEDALEHLR